MTVHWLAALPGSYRLANLLRLALHFSGQLATLDAGIKAQNDLEQAALLQL